MVDIKKVDNPEINSLEDIAKLVKQLVKDYSSKEVILKSGVDKNVIYRLEHEQNVTLDNYLKIKNAFPEVFKTPNKGTGMIPIVGQIVENIETLSCKVHPLNPAQPKEFTAPVTLIKRFTPLYAYLYQSSNAYHSCVHIFTTADIDYTKIQKQCSNRLIMAFPPNDDVYYGTVHKQEGKYVMRSALTQQAIKEFPLDNKVAWSRWICLLPFSMMEFGTKNEHSYNQDWAVQDYKANVSILNKAKK